MPPISVLMKPSSGMCNMHCDYCFYCDEAQKRLQKSYGFMSEETLKNVIRKTILRAEGVVSYAFQGGEPTLRGLDFFPRRRLPMKNSITAITSRCRMLFRQMGIFWMMNGVHFSRKTTF